MECAGFLFNLWSIVIALACVGSGAATLALYRVVGTKWDFGRYILACQVGVFIEACCAVISQFTIPSGSACVAWYMVLRIAGRFVEATGCVFLSLYLLGFVSRPGKSAP